MYGLFGSWSWPTADQRAAFEADYNDTFLPLLRAVPHVVSVDLAQADDSGLEFGIYRVGTMWFSSEEQYKQAAATREWSAMWDRCNSLLERYGMELQFAYVHDGAQPAAA